MTAGMRRTGFAGGANPAIHLTSDQPRGRAATSPNKQGRSRGGGSRLDDLTKLYKTIDAINRKIGLTVAWLALGMVLEGEATV